MIITLLLTLLACQVPNDEHADDGQRYPDRQDRAEKYGDPEENPNDDDRPSRTALRRKPDHRRSNGADHQVRAGEHLTREDQDAIRPWSRGGGGG